jgi:hypothetical protein
MPEHDPMAAIGVAIRMEMIMEKTLDYAIDGVIDLGSATEETRGGQVGVDDTLNGRHISAGLTDD